MKKLSRNLFLMSLALTLALAACKDDSKKDGKEQSKDDSPKEVKDKPAWQKAPQIGDQCHPGVAFLSRCEGNNLIDCIADTSSDDGIISATVKKEPCEEGTKCVEYSFSDGDEYAICESSARIFASCQAALEDLWTTYDADSDKERHTCSKFISGHNVGLYEAPECVAAGDGYKLLDQFCSKCTVNLQEKSVTCTPPDDSFTGASAQEGDSCNTNTFVPRRLDKSSALTCVYDEKTDGDKVKKTTCSAGLEVAFWTNAAFCIDPQEAECGSQVFKCATLKGRVVSLLDKVCIHTDKGYHLVAFNNYIPEELNNETEMLYYFAIKCGAKGCDEATGTCIDIASSK